MAIAPITAVISVQPIDAISPSDSYPEDRVFRARVMQMLSPNMARLAIEGQTVDVATAKPLPVGSTLTLRAEWQDGKLRLLAEETRAGAGSPQGAPAASPAPSAQPAPTSPAQGGAAPATPQTIAARPEQAAANAAARASAAAAPPTIQAAAPPSNVLAPMRAALTHIQAMAVEAMLSGLGGEAEAVEHPQQPAPPAPSRAETAAALRQVLTGPPPATAPAPPLLPGAALDLPLPLPVEEQRQAATVQQPVADPTLRQPLPEGALRGQTSLNPMAAGQPFATAEPEAAAAEKGKAGVAAIAGAEAPPPEPPRAERLATLTVQLPLYLPGSELPVRLQISREQRESEEGAERVQRDPSWIVRFSSETGRLGPIHAAISLVDGHVGVQLWAERGDTAEWFRDHSGQLRDALIASDVQLDAVRISHGSPLSPGGE